MRTYIVKWNQKKMKSRAEDAFGAIQRLAERPVFGKCRIFFAPKLAQFDADTCGQEWAEAYDGSTRIVAMKPGS